MRGSRLFNKEAKGHLVIRSKEVIDNEKQQVIELREAMRDRLFNDQRQQVI